ncbi:MAG: diaminobutyrate acetyltransferase [Pseudonocardia sp.]
MNSRYACALWCRDFSETSVVARDAGSVVGFVTGFRRPTDPATLLVWQVAVDRAARGRGLASRRLNSLVTGIHQVGYLETTITPDNIASIAPCTGFARRQGAAVQRAELFGPALLGADHQPENLFRIGPMRGATT